MPSRLAALLRTCLFGAVFLLLVLVLLPNWFGVTASDGHWSGWRLAGLLPLVVGAAIVLWCAFAFSWYATGTPAPFDPPRKLVVQGLYRYCRNPMYWGLALLLVGEFMIWAQRLREALIFLAVIALCVNLFVLFFEEPTLRRKFGAAYDAYCRAVPRWWWRMRAFE